MAAALTTAATELAGLIVRYLDDPTHWQHRQWLVSASWTRPVNVIPLSWGMWLAAGGYANRPRSFVGTPFPKVYAEAESFASGLVVDQPPYARIDGDMLARLSAEQRDSGTGLVRLWTAVMMWGSGTTNGRGPWRTAQGLADPRLLTTLQITADAVRAGSLREAYGAFWLKGCGESFFTKWFWACSLTEPDRRALILDRRVRRSLASCGLTSWTRPRGASGYERYVELLHDAAQMLADVPGLGRCDAERLEWLLFDRPIDHGEPCFHRWLVELQGGRR